MCGGEEMTAAFLYWWECLWIFEGPLNLPWDEIRKRQPLCVAFIFPQHNISLFLKALYNSCVNPLPRQNVSIIQRPFSHTHYSGVIHISFFLSSADGLLCVSVRVHIEQRRIKVCEKKQKENKEKMTRDRERGTGSGDCCQVRMIYPSTRTLVAPEPVQLQPCPVKTHLTFSSTLKL